MNEDYEVNVAEVLPELIYNRSLEIEKFEAGTDERKLAVDDFETLYKLLIEQQKMVYSNEQAEKELRNQEAQEKSRKLDRWLNFGLTLGTTIVSTLACGWYFARSCRFEETGSYCSTTAKNMTTQFVNKFFKK